MSNESHPSPTGSSSSSLFGENIVYFFVKYTMIFTLGGGGVNEPITQPSPAKPTWAQILNSNPNAPSNTSSTTTTTGNNNNNNTNVGGNNSPSSSSPSSQHSATTKNISPSASGTIRPGFMPNFYDQQQSQMNWSLNFNQQSSWMINDDDTQKQPINSSQQSNDNTHTGGNDAFDRIESSSPTTDWNKPVTNNNSTANGWSNFQQQQNPSRSNPPSNQWPEMNNFYGNNTPTNSFNNDNNNSSTWQDPSSTGNATDTLQLTTNKHKTSSMAASITGALKSAIALSGGNGDILNDNNETMITYVPQPKLVEQLGWDQPETNVAKRGHFDDGTSIWGDPMESMSAPVKKWTNGTKSALTNSTNIIQTPQIVQKPMTGTNSSTSSSSQLISNDENWPRQQSPPIVQQSSSQWNDSSSSNINQTNSNQQQQQQQQPPPQQQQQHQHQHQQQQQQQNYHQQSTNWNQQSHSSDDWFRDGVVDTSDWGLQGPQHKAPFDPYEGQVDTTSWGVQGGGGGGGGGGMPVPGQMPMARNNRFMNEYDLNENPHDVRMPNYDNQSINDPYRQNSDLKNSMMNMGGILPSTHHPFPPRPGPHYPPQSGNILRPINPNGGLSTPPGAIIGQGNHLSPKLPTSSPVPNQAPYVPLTNKQNNIPNQTSQTPTPSQQQTTGNGNNNNPNNNNNGAVHAQIMQQFRLAVQAGLISQDLLNTKLPPYMLQVRKKENEFY